MSLINSKLPERSAGEHRLKSGRSVWVKTLNSLQRNEARECADMAAARVMQRYRRGTDGEAVLLQQMECLGPPELLQLVYDAELAEASQRSALLWPDIPHPVRDAHETDEGFADRVTAWDHACLELPARREEYAVAQAQRIRVQAQSLEDAQLLEMCMRYWRAQRYQQEFGVQFALHTVSIAVRDCTDHSVAVWPNATAVADLDDDEREAVVARYLELDSVTDAMVPTLPLRCCAPAA